VVSGWYVERLPDWLHNSWSYMSQTLFGRDFVYIGAGGTVPFVGILNKEFPSVPIMCSGVSQPDSNIHGPNESVNVEYLKKFVVALIYVIAEHAKQ